MTTAAIVQARLGSSRLPGKVLLDLGGKPVLRHVLERCAQAPGVDVVVCAIPDNADNEPLAAVAEACGTLLFRGPETDVLDRYLGAARMSRADIVMRVTSDCPLIDPEICGKLLALRAETDADYASNLTPRSFPKGLDCEAFTTARLEEAASFAFMHDDREHVTPWFRRAPHISRANLFSGDESLAGLRWTLDYPEDLEFLRAVREALPASSPANLAEVLELLRSNPEINAIHARCTQRDHNERPR